MFSTTTSNMSLAPKCPEYKARTNFIRLMAMSAKHFNMTWQVAGSFIRHLISGNTNIKGTSMIIFLTPQQSMVYGNNNAFAGLKKMRENVVSMVNELEIMGMKVSQEASPCMSKGLNGLEPSHVSASLEAEMFIADAGRIMFPVLIKAFDKESSLFDDSLYPFSTDPIVLGSHGIQVNKKNSVLDGMNQYPGISLLERMVKIQQERSVVQLNSFLTNNTMVGLATNSTLMRNIKQIKEEGFNIIGDTIETNSTCREGLCPICLEVNETFVPLECTHSFCLSCLASHLMSNVNGAECPMCRSQIIPCLKTTNV